MKKATVYRSQDDKLTVNIYPNLPSKSPSICGKYHIYVGGQYHTFYKKHRFFYRRKPSPMV